MIAAGGSFLHTGSRLELPLSIEVAVPILLVAAAMFVALMYLFYVDYGEVVL